MSIALGWLSQVRAPFLTLPLWYLRCAALPGELFKCVQMRSNLFKPIVAFVQLVPARGFRGNIDNDNSQCLQGFCGIDEAIVSVSTFPLA